MTAKPSPTPRKVLLDTNCFVRLYCSPLLPLMQQVVGDHQLLTLQVLGEEFFDSERLTRVSAPWIVRR